MDTQPTEESTQPTEAKPAHSPLYIKGLDVEDVIQYFNEVCLDAEVVNGGDTGVLQKWTAPIYYMLNGNPTKEDLLVLFDFVAWLNTIEGFPACSRAMFWVRQICRSTSVISKIIYAEFSEPQSLTSVDELILKLLYHPQMKMGMDATECEAVIRQLYY